MTDSHPESPRPEPPNTACPRCGCPFAVANGAIVECAHCGDKDREALPAPWNRRVAPPASPPDLDSVLPEGHIAIPVSVAFDLLTGTRARYEAARKNLRVIFVREASLSAPHQSTTTDEILCAVCGSPQRFDVHGGCTTTGRS